MMFLMRLYFWKQLNKNRERPQLVRCHVHSRFFYFVKLLNLPALDENLDVLFWLWKKNNISRKKKEYEEKLYLNEKNVISLK